MCEELNDLGNNRVMQEQMDSLAEQHDQAVAEWQRLNSLSEDELPDGPSS